MQTLVVTVWLEFRAHNSSRIVRTKIQAALSAFAAILTDGSVVTWGHAENGGDSSAVRDQLKGVQQIQATGAAFAAVRQDCGGDTLAVRKKPRFV